METDWLNHRGRMRLSGLRLKGLKLVEFLLRRTMHDIR